MGLFAKYEEEAVRGRGREKRRVHHKIFPDTPGSKPLAVHVSETLTENLSGGVSEGEHEHGNEEQEAGHRLHEDAHNEMFLGREHPGTRKHDPGGHREEDERKKHVLHALLLFMNDKDF